MDKRDIITVLLSGGSGKRTGRDMPKQYISAGGCMMITRSLKALTSHPDIRRIRIVADRAWQDKILSEWKEQGIDAELLGFSLPGETRQLSVFNALEDILPLASDDTRVIIHDAARPFVSPALLERVIKSGFDADGAIPVLPMKDTVYLSDGGQRISGLLDRSKIYAGQAPEIFKFKEYHISNSVLMPDRILTINGSTEPAIISGMNISMVAGEESNFKITSAEDLDAYIKMS
ncbi:MAG: 2-C-methyl-D-erythritol 4-phosphate cytidylyltransferase [Lachnospiraceae bacterium]|nr:2-C-methyl-D-erythritol 4-phosphate cytidylyltransferase [Lachnospiraceae bacterium]